MPAVELRIAPTTAWDMGAWNQSFASLCDSNISQLDNKKDTKSGIRGKSANRPRAFKPVAQFFDSFTLDPDELLRSNSDEAASGR